MSASRSKGAAIRPKTHSRPATQHGEPCDRSWPSWDSDRLLRSAVSALRLRNAVAVLRKRSVAGMVANLALRLFVRDMLVAQANGNYAIFKPRAGD